ncbi:hypothetical protein DPMN_012662 [Dreissena polymorpha]|uniref:Uncharacterized protein n=1 Tax=Dreissena polymorpha TaxID=45954 RepID=A0A9D4N678_DREPO|nr:hypothetical protein DPMN_012662 [Dreissena polymorpha]
MKAVTSHIGAEGLHYVYELSARVRPYESQANMKAVASHIDDDWPIYVHDVSDLVRSYESQANMKEVTSYSYAQVHTNLFF